jgi:type VI protein secretion system component VasF
MPDEQTDKMVKLLEEIRDLTKERNQKLETLLQTTSERYEEALQRQKEAQARVLSQRRRFLWTLTPLLLLALGLMVYIGFWVIPKSERRDAERWMEQMRMIGTNQVARPR